mmetsp:Transcript_8683/g.20278  ORF Transcript_8683/g.20278 Transcript_8683/m.20278 type:complete len:294 (-) Transcript_8683:157-1038(-)
MKSSPRVDSVDSIVSKRHLGHVCTHNIKRRAVLLLCAFHNLAEHTFAEVNGNDLGVTLTRSKAPDHQTRPAREINHRFVRLVLEELLDKLKLLLDPREPRLLEAVAPAPLIHPRHHGSPEQLLPQGSARQLHARRSKHRREDARRLPPLHRVLLLGGVHLGRVGSHVDKASARGEGSTARRARCLVERAGSAALRASVEERGGALVYRLADGRRLRAAQDGAGGGRTAGGGGAGDDEGCTEGGCEGEGCGGGEEQGERGEDEEDRGPVHRGWRSLFVQALRIPALVAANCCEA